MSTLIDDNDIEIYRAVKLGLMLIESCWGESFATALALHTLLVIRLPVFNTYLVS